MRHRYFGPKHQDHGLASSPARLCCPTRLVWPSRRRVRFTLRTLLAGVAVSAVSIAWYMAGVRAQRAAVEAMWACRATAKYTCDDDTDERYWIPRLVAAHCPRWLYKALGKDFLFGIDEVQLAFAEFSGPDAEQRIAAQDVLRKVSSLRRLRVLTLNERHSDDSSARSLGELRGLQWLNVLNASRFTDVGAHCMGGLTKLKGLRLANLRVTDESLSIIGGFRELEVLELDFFLPASMPCGEDLSVVSCTRSGTAHLGNLQNLRDLNLSMNPAVTDNWMGPISALTNLEVLNLRGTDVTYRGVLQLATLKKLRWLDLSAAGEIDDRAMVAVASLPDLKELYLGGANVTARCLHDLRRLAKLTCLDLSGACGIGDEAIQHLRRLPALVELDVGGTSITLEGAKGLADLKQLRRLTVAFPLDSPHLALWEYLRLSLPNCVINFPIVRPAEAANGG